MKKIPKPLLIILIAVSALILILVAVVVGYRFLNDTSEPQQDPNTNQQPVDRATIKKKEITLKSPDNSGSVTFTIEVSNLATLNLYPNNDQTKATVSLDDMEMEFAYTDLGPERYEVEGFNEVVKLDNYQLDDVFRVTNDTGVFYVYPLIDELECDRLFISDIVKPEACGENRIRYMNYKPLRVEYTGDMEFVSQADDIIKSFTLTKSEGVTTENTRQKFPIEYWRGDGGYLELSTILPQNTAVTLGGRSGEATTQIIYNESIVSLSIPHTSEVVSYRSAKKIGRLDGRDVYRYTLKDSGDTVYVSDLVDSGTCESGEKSVYKPCGSNLILIEDKGFNVVFSGLGSDLAMADLIVLSLQLEGLSQQQ